LIVGKVSAKKRAELKPSQFGLPEKARTKKARKEPGNYPMPDKGHAISAVRLAKKNHKESNCRRRTTSASLARPARSSRADSKVLTT
jgi:hypothetical protein